MRKYVVTIDCDVYIDLDELNYGNDLFEGVARSFASREEAWEYADRLCLCLAKGMKENGVDYEEIRSQINDKAADKGASAVTIDIDEYGESDWIDSEFHSYVWGSY